MTALSAGTRLGPYEIIELIGAGGMGEVYKASDTRLGRTVAIKVLPAHWAENSEMKQRLEREARTIASLNHPHICTLHDIGRENETDFLVMEYLVGETLATRLTRGALGLDEALAVARAIAGALDRAHSQGMVHRDLKPSNVMLVESGPKLLDFGLAKWKATSKSVSSANSRTGAPTQADVTTPGAVLGTLQYMAPEQLEGIEADARTDIFSFGVLLYEMVTGRKAFEGKSRVLLMSAIAASEPEALSKSQPAAPAALEHVVRTCLAKDPKDRWQTARDLLAELDWIAEGGAAGLVPPAADVQKKRDKLYRIALAAGAVLAAGMAVATVIYFRGPQKPGEFRFRVPYQLSAQATVASGFNATNIAVSPDGKSIVISARASGDNANTLYVRPLNAVTPLKLPGTEDAAQPFFSSDSRSIGFVVGGKLKKVDASGGPPQDICDAVDFSGGAWTGDTIVFGSAVGIFRVSAQGGKPAALTTLDANETGHLWPSFLPDGRHFLYLAWAGDSGKRTIYAGSLDSKEKTRIMAGESKVFYSAPGYLLYDREDTVYAQTFDAGKLQVSGDPLRVADETPSIADGQSTFWASPNGVLVYFYLGGGNVATGGNGGRPLELTWINNSGQAVEPNYGIGPSGVYRGVDVSRDGKRIAVHRHDGTGGDIWVIEPPDKGTANHRPVTRITFDPSRDNSSPVWSPDDAGTYIVYASLQKGKWGLYRKQSSGVGTEELLYEDELPKAPMSWVGNRIVFWVRDSAKKGDVWVLNMEGEKREAKALIATPADETHPQISHDGKWIAYTSNVTGNRNEIYVKEFPPISDGWQVSNNGGDWPRWRKDNKGLFYHSLGGLNTPSVRVLNGTFIGPLISVAAGVNGPVFVPGSPKEVVGLEAINLNHSGGDYNTYAVSPDASQFLIFTLVNTFSASTGPANAAAGPEPVRGLTVALNWAAAFKR